MLWVSAGPAAISINTTLGQSVVFACLPPSSQQTQNLCITFVQRWTNVDVDPTLYKCYTNVLCLLGWRGWRDYCHLSPRVPNLFT